MTQLDKRHKNALIRAYEHAKQNGGDLQARYLRETLRVLGIVPPKAAKPKPVAANFLTQQFRASAALAEVVGHQPLSRVDVVKKLWSYIKKNKLQDTLNKRYINCNEVLQAVFHKPTVSMFEMAVLIGPHLS